MKCRKVIASVLCVAMAAGFAGCDNTKKSQEQIEDVMEKYTEALNGYDGDGILELTNWDDDSDDYEFIEKAFDTKNIAKSDGEEFVNCIEYIASKIKVEYDISDVEVKDKEASLKVTYKIINWESAYFEYSYYSFDDVVDTLKSTKDTVTVKGKITFELDGKEWKISKITKFNELCGFALVLPNVIEDDDPLPDPTETEPTTTTEPTETTADVETYKKAIYSYINFLGGHEEAIRHAEKIYSKGFCGIYDINGDGVPELLFIEANDMEDDYSSGTLFVCYYNQKTGQTVEAIRTEEFVYMAEGSQFIIYATTDALLIAHGYGESANHYLDTEVYDSNLDYYASYRCNSRYMYDPETDSENYSYSYYTGYMGNYSECDLSFYGMMLEYYVNDAYVILASDYSPLQGDVEYPLNKLPQNGFVSYDELVKYLNSQL